MYIYIYIYIYIYDYVYIIYIYIYMYYRLARASRGHRALGLGGAPLGPSEALCGPWARPLVGLSPWPEWCAPEALGRSGP